MNRDISLDLYEVNRYFEAFLDFDIMKSDYYTENSFYSSFRNKQSFFGLGLNAQSLPAKFNQLTNTLDEFYRNDMQISCLAIQETWNISNANLKIPGFNFFSKTRSNSRGGGLGVYIRDVYPSQIFPEFCLFIENVYESVAVKVHTPDGKSFVIISLYRPNQHNLMTYSEQCDTFLQHFHEHLDMLSSINIPVIIFTDSNFNLSNCGVDDKITSYVDTFHSFGFLNVISKATRLSNESKTFIDQILINDFFDKICSSGVNIDSPSDHFFTFIEINLIKPIKSDNESFFTRKFSDFNKNNFRNSLFNRTWRDVYSSDCPNEAFNLFWDTFKQLYDIHFPLISVKPNKNKTPINPFMSRGLLISRQTKLKLMRKSKTHPTLHNILIARNYRNLYISTVKKAKKLYISDCIKSAGNDSKKIWNTINWAKNSNSKINSIDSIEVDNVRLQNDKEIANNFNTFFSEIGHRVSDSVPTSNRDFREYLPPPSQRSFFLSPVSRNEMLNYIYSIKRKKSNDVNGISMDLIFSIADIIAEPLAFLCNLSFEHGVFPDMLKVTKTVPIFKKSGSPLDMSNYRGVSIAIQFSKIFERVMSDKLLSFLNDQDFFYENQFGFLKGHSCNHAIIKLINFISNKINNGEICILFSFDVMKCFDSVRHDYLLIKLENAGIRGPALDWFKSFLSNRTQKVVVNNIFSDNICFIDISVLQGSILGVILFLIFTNDIYRCSEILFSIIFADDLNSLLSDTNLESLIARANIEIAKLNEWYKANKLSVHPQKSKMMLFQSPFNPLWRPNPNSEPYLPIFLNNNNSGESDISKICPIKLIPNSNESSMKILGFYIDEKLNLSEHMKYLHGQLSKSIYSLVTLKNYLDKDCLKLVYYAHFHSHINYCSNLFSMASKKSLNPIIILQKKAIRILTNSHYRQHTSQLFKDEGILPFEQLIELNSSIFIHDYQRDRLPKSFNNTWIQNNLRPGYELGLALRNQNELDIPRLRYTYLAQHPLYKFPSIWNNLNIELKSCQRRSEFIRKMKRFLFDNLPP